MQQLHGGLADYYRAKGLTIVVMVDPTNGLDRSAEAPELVARGRSIREPAIQALYRDFVVAMATVIRPAYLGLVAETNLIRAVAPADLYQALVQAAGPTAAAVRSAGFTGALYVSVQVETAWGLAPPGPYAGIAADLRDFPFIEALGLSSYPYFVHPDPASLPADYYRRLATEAGRPVMVVEGGWTSAPVVWLPGTPERQARYLAKQAQLLDASEALFVFQLTFADLGLAAIPGSGNLAPFAYLGLVTADLTPKPALVVWDSLFALPR